MRKTFSGYRILQKIGGGTNGIVYRAFDPKNQRELALKILPNNFLLTHEKRARFMREAKAISVLNHPAIAELLHAGECDQCYYLAMEYVSGETFGQVINNHPHGVPMPMFFDLMIPILDGISLAHEHGIAHRDIKPENLRIAGTGQPKVLDFGLAKFIYKAGAHQDSFQTMKGMVLGSAGYMSPEQANGEQLDARTDIFSLGILMYELLTGKNPFISTNVFTTITKVLTATPISVELLRPQIPHALSDLVFQCLVKDVSHRYPSARSLHDALVALKG